MLLPSLPLQASDPDTFHKPLRPPLLPKHGVFTLFLPDQADGTTAIQHRCQLLNLGSDTYIKHLLPHKADVRTAKEHGR